MLLDFEKTRELLEKYQIPLVESLLIDNLQQGIEFARENGWPVVLKLLSSGNLHKIDKGLVRLNIKNAQELTLNLAKLSSEEEGVQGRSETPSQVVIQKQVSGIELFMGMKRDKSFGPVASFALGGIFVEVLQDVVFGICPIDKVQAAKMVEGIKGYKILQGYRGQLPVDLEKLADILVNIGKMAMANENIKEIDLNPIMANGKEIFIVDPKIILET